MENRQQLPIINHLIHLQGWFKNTGTNTHGLALNISFLQNTRSEKYGRFS